MLFGSSSGMYGYANARIRGMRSYLLRPDEVHALAAVPGLADFVARLAQTDYEPDLRLARERFAGIALVEETLRRNLARRLRSIRGFFSSPCEGASLPARLAAVILGRYDLSNLLAVLRARASGASWADVHGAILPAGEMDADQLAQLAEQPDANGMIALMRRWLIPLAGVVAEVVVGEHRNTVLLETALWLGFAHWAHAALSGSDPSTLLVRDWLELETDAANLITVVRLAHRSARPDRQSVSALLAPGGSVPIGRMADLVDEPSGGAVIAALGRSPLARAAAAAAARDLCPDEAVALEMGVEQYRSRWARAQGYRDPLGIGVLLAYHATKTDEVRGLRLIARGLERGWPRQRLEGFLEPVAT